MHASSKYHCQLFVRKKNDVGLQGMLLMLPGCGVQASVQRCGSSALPLALPLVLPLAVSLQVDLQGVPNQVEHMPSLTGLLFFLNGSARALVLLFLLCACACMSACVGCSNGMQDASTRTCITNDKMLVELALQPLMMIQNTTVHVTGASWICEYCASCTPASHGTNLAVIM